MTLRFHIDYHTQWGERLAISFDDPQLPSLQLNSSDGKQWVGILEVPSAQHRLQLSYRYSLWRDSTCLRHESRIPTHHLSLPTCRGEYFVFDAWQDRPPMERLYAEAFAGREVSHASAIATSVIAEGGGSICLRAHCPTLLSPHHGLALLGESEPLGAWTATRARCLERCDKHHWQLSLKPTEMQAGVAYKLVIFDRNRQSIVAWEDGENRHVSLPPCPDGAQIVLPSVAPRFSTLAPRLAGVAIPVFSLRSTGSQGVGDFGDLRSLVDWAAQTGQRLVQLLPINDTTASKRASDSYPYNAISIFALHPLYIDLRQLPPLRTAKRQADFEAQFVKLNALPQVDYEAVFRTKMDFLQQHFAEVSPTVLRSEAFRLFCEQNSDWLPVYSSFCCLRDKYGSADFHCWGEFSVYRDSIPARLRSDEAQGDALDFYAYLQFVLHEQLLQISHYARERGIVLKGDIPIGISPCSVEAWSQAHLFNMNAQAGAPPDAFAAEGQNWGFPTYNWEAMRAEDYAWWKRRFTKMADYFSAYRIDHILGFFRIWSIPQHSVQGLLGQFDPALPLTVEEIEAMGLGFCRERMVEPYITETVVKRHFGNDSEVVKRNFLERRDGCLWQLRPEVATQRQIDKRLQAMAAEDKAINRLRKGLFALCNEVLFVEDAKEHNKYHPRIAGYDTAAFEDLEPESKEAFCRIHEEFFYRRHNIFWFEKAMEKLPQLVDATAMVPCGEDLGMVPDCVAWAMEALQILSLEIERMPKAFGTEFGNPEKYPVLSVCTIGTHDMDTLRGWWEEDKQRSERYFAQLSQRDTTTPARATAELCGEIVKRNLNSPSMLCVLALQDWLALSTSLEMPEPAAERINIPADPHHVWSYRMFLPLEVLQREEELNATILRMIRESGRC